ncbi:MAG TPA: type II secretion system protein [Piscirickettsiaceae bacterium]|nr:type II secretion system protein [Piscirickettsiaceae bacterium]
MQNKRKQKGFTLIEFLLIIAVVGVLIAVAFTIYSSVKKSSDAQAFADKGRAFLSSIENYVRDNNNTYLTGTCNTPTAWSQTPCLDLRNYVGQALANEGWQYTCSSGGNPQIQTPTIVNAEIGFQVAQKLSNFGQSAGWNCSYSDTNKIVSCTNNNITCP